MKRLALALFAAVMIWATPAAAGTAGSSSGLACSIAVTPQSLNVNVTGMRTSNHLLYELQLTGPNGYAKGGLTPFPPPSSWSFGFVVPPPGTYTAEVDILKAEGNPQAGPSGWTFYGFTFVPNLCSVTI